MARQFNGKIALDIRDSTPDWDAFLDQKAPKDAPNVLVILYDDTGCAAWSTYGGRINMPTLDRLASQGLTYSQWHTTSVCSPTRSTLLTGRNHHQNGFGTIAESAAGFPATPATSRWRTRRSRRCCATRAGAPSGSARTTTCPSMPSTSAPIASTGRWAWATTGSTASSAARPTSGIRS